MEYKESDQYTNLINNLQHIQKELDFCFHNEQLLIQACTHKSFLNEFSYIVPISYERLEFLGDTILNGVVTEYLYYTYPQSDEGSLSKIKAQWVSQKCLAQTMSLYDINTFLLTGRGERLHRLHQQETILADLFEALVGALFIDQGWEAAKKFVVHTHISRCDIENLTNDNPKAALQEWCLKHKFGLPHYILVKEFGPQHDPTFTMGVLIQDKPICEASGKTKRQAEAEAAREALTRISEKSP